MHDVLDIYTIIFLALAVLIFLKLRSVLGQRTGRERPPYDPFAARDTARTATNDKVVALPSRNAEAAARAIEPPPADRWKGIAEEGTPVASGLDAIVRADPKFDPTHFIGGARGAYEMIVNAFASGDRRTLRTRLSRDVYEGFEAAIRDREAKGETVESRFVSLDQAEIIGAEMRGNTAQVTIRFVSQLISATHDRDGNVIDGSSDRLTDVTDVWTFARDVTSRDPNWNLVATEAGQ